MIFCALQTHNRRQLNTKVSREKFAKDGANEDVRSNFAVDTVGYVVGGLFQFTLGCSF